MAKFTPPTAPAASQSGTPEECTCNSKVQDCGCCAICEPCKLHKNRVVDYFGPEWNRLYWDTVGCGHRTRVREEMKRRDWSAFKNDAKKLIDAARRSGRNGPRDENSRVGRW